MRHTIRGKQAATFKMKIPYLFHTIYAQFHHSQASKFSQHPGFRFDDYIIQTNSTKLLEQSQQIIPSRYQLQYERTISISPVEASSIISCLFPADGFNTKETTRLQKEIRIVRCREESAEKSDSPRNTSPTRRI